MFVGIPSFVVLDASTGVVVCKAGRNDVMAGNVEAAIAKWSINLAPSTPKDKAIAQVQSLSLSLIFSYSLFSPRIHLPYWRLAFSYHLVHHSHCALALLISSSLLVYTQSLLFAKQNCNSTQYGDMLKLIERYITNILKAVNNPKYRGIRLSNKLYIKNIGAHRGGAEILTAFGFKPETREGGEKYLLLPITAGDTPHLQSLVRLVQREKAKLTLGMGVPAPSAAPAPSHAPPPTAGEFNTLISTLSNSNTFTSTV